MNLSRQRQGREKDLKWGTWGYELVFKYKDLLIQSNFVLHGIEEFIYMEENYVRLHTYFICWTSNNFKKCTWNVCTDSSDGNQFYSPLYFIVWMRQGDIAAHCSKVNMKICIYWNGSCPGKDMKLALIGSWCKPTRSLGTNGLFQKVMDSQAEHQKKSAWKSFKIFPDELIKCSIFSSCQHLTQYFSWLKLGKMEIFWHVKLWTNHLPCTVFNVVFHSKL